MKPERFRTATLKGLKIASDTKNTSKGSRNGTFFYAFTRTDGCRSTGSKVRRGFA